ncbi:MAG TPA: efflux RND transporter periplasmic adaptor subunit [Candidatus Deferrimicrobiaceae bacterium]|jgi:cobalt-zinc-cadmium efflux system membrane fusion protein
MTNKRTAIIVAAAAAGVIVAAVAFRQFGPQRTPTPAAREEGSHNDGRGHEEHDEHAENAVVRLGDAELKEFGIEVGTAAPGNLKIHVSLPGEVVPNADRLAHVVPRVSGVVREVRKGLGDRVHKGEVMAVLESRDLADAKAAFLNATEKLALARATFSREEDLWKKKISPEQDYLQAKQALAEARIELRSAEQKLHSLGFSDEYLAQLPSQPDMSYTRYEIAAPFEGTVIEKHISTGEAHKEDAEVFIVADLNSVWVNLSVYQKDMPFIRKGQPVVVSAGHGIPDTSGVISYIGPLVGEQTRTAVARVVLPNTGGNLRPGLFVTGLITVDSVPVSLLVPKTAIQTVEDKPSVFVKTDEGFVLQPVTVGRSNETHVEITSGIKPGTQYVKSGAFTLKAQLSKRAFGDGHAH